jgi:hypothetical protein
MILFVKFEDLILLGYILFFLHTHTNTRARELDSSVGIATHYGLDDPVIESRWGERFFAPVQTDPEAYAASYKAGIRSVFRR